MEIKNTLLLLASFIILMAFVPALAQAQEKPGELPLDNFQFKAGHNSYDEDEDMDDQIDNYNVWCVELDLQWETDCGPCITVDHCCPEVPGCWGEQRLHESIAEIMRSTELSRRVTFIWLEIKASGSFWDNNWCHEDWPPNRREIIRDTLLGLIGEENIYRQSDFDKDFQTNGGRWPSWQELRRRGKKFILVLEDPFDEGECGKAYDPVMFIAVKSHREAEEKYPWATFVNVQDADTSNEAPLPNDRYIYRAWFDIHTDDHDTWEAGASRGFNLIGSDDVDGDYTITDVRTHSPQPLFVDGTASSSARLWGTRNFPMSQIASAVSRATPGTTLMIRPGNYPSPCMFDKPLALQPDPRYPGAVVIGGHLFVGPSGSVGVYGAGNIRIH
jgi:hypothetical protein